MRNLLKFLIVVILLGFQANSILAQSKKKQKKTAKPAKDTTYIITLRNEDELIGKIANENENEIVLIESVDLIKTIIPKDLIVSKVLNAKRKKALKQNPHPTRYLFSPSAFPLKKKTGYINSFMLFGYQAQYGLTENISAGVTTSLIFAPFLVDIKYSIEMDPQFHLAIGGQVGKFILSDDGMIGMAFTTATYGSKNDNISLNVGYGSYNKEGMFISTFSGITRLANNVSLLAEFWYCEPKGGTPFIMGGPAVRVYSGKRATFDIGLTGIGFKEDYYDWQYDKNTQNWIRGEKRTYWDAYYPIPVVSISYKF